MFCNTTAGIGNLEVGRYAADTGGTDRIEGWNIYVDYIATLLLESPYSELCYVQVPEQNSRRYEGKFHRGSCENSKQLTFQVGCLFTVKKNFVFRKL